jgi:hypothetical protein
MLDTIEFFLELNNPIVYHGHASAWVKMPLGDNLILHDALLQ